jgi:coproporphyrinogen III oxidase-like Fe-S oxidoreductase
MLGLRQAAGIDVQRIAERFGLAYAPEWFVRARQLEESGWIRFDNDRLQLTAKGRLAANSVIEELLWPTPTATAPHCP